jgi:flagellar FliJ protein
LRNFSFRLQTVLNVRELYEEEAERNFREAILNLALAVEALKKLRDDLAHSIEELGKVREQDVNVNIQVLYDDYFRSLRWRIDKQILAVRNAEELVEERRFELQERMKERKTIEQLRIRNYESFLQELRRFEQGVIDDLSVLRSKNPHILGLNGIAIQ